MLQKGVRSPLVRQPMRIMQTRSVRTQRNDQHWWGPTLGWGDTAIFVVRGIIQRNAPGYKMALRGAAGKRNNRLGIGEVAYTKGNEDKLFHT
jgi:hypothetical protein